MRYLMRKQSFSWLVSSTWFRISYKDITYDIHFIKASNAIFGDNSAWCGISYLDQRSSMKTSKYIWSVERKNKQVKGCIDALLYDVNNMPRYLSCLLIVTTCRNWKSKYAYYETNCKNKLSFHEDHFFQIITRQV